MNSSTKNYIAACLIFILGFTYHFKYINEFPSHIHAWAQSDHYALALGFQNNGFNFFKPETFVYNHQFPNDFKIPAEYTTTAVDFPIHDFVPAVLMKIFGNNPWVFQLYILLFSFLGLYYLYKLAFYITNNYLKSLLILIFAGTSPVFVYYQSGFLPSIPSLATAIAGVYFYLKFIRENEPKHFKYSIALLTLATLTRSTFAIVLLSVAGVEFIRIIKKESSFKKQIIPVLFSFGFIGFYIAYNSYLRNTYGSIFLNHLMPPKDWAEIKLLLTQVKENWKYQYISKYHYLLFGLVFISGTLLFFTRKRKIENPMGYLILLTGSVFTGCVLFFYVMMKQMPAHDYYFLDTFYLPMVLFMIIFITYLEFEMRFLKLASVVAASLLLYGMVLYPIETQEKRRETGSWDKIRISIDNFSDSKALLDSLKIPSDAKILVLDPGAPNIPFIFMERKGMVVLNTGKEFLQESLKWKADYIVIQNEYFVSDIYSNYPEIVTRLKKMGDNGKISVCKLSPKKLNQDLTQFLDLENRPAILRMVNDFEKEENSQWQNFKRDSTHAVSGSYSGYLNASTEFGLTYKSTSIRELADGSRIVLFTGNFYRKQESDCEVVVSVNGKDGSLFYKGQNLKYLIRNNEEWQKVVLTFHLPKIENDEYEFGIYIYNTGKSEIWYDDFAFGIY